MPRIIDNIELSLLPALRETIDLSERADFCVGYLERELRRRGIDDVAGVSGGHSNPTTMTWRFSPESNGKRRDISPDQELRVLVATDVLSEGQNLQDRAIVVNYDLPWAIIRLIQRAGRVDRIGQKADRILCYSFLPADGVERIIRLRARVRQRLDENAEVVGTDEAFFEGDRNDHVIRDLFTEKAGILDDEDGEVDLSSQAYEIWKNAIESDPSLEKKVKALPPVILSTKPHKPAPATPEGVLAFIKNCVRAPARHRPSQDTQKRPAASGTGGPRPMKEYTVIYEQGPDNWSAYVPDCIATGKTRQAVEQQIREAIVFHIEGLRQYGEAIPQPTIEAGTITVSQA